MTPPLTRADYGPEDLEGARSLCLFLATLLGDLVEHTVIVGGLVPALLVGEAGPRAESEPHIGTKDVDLGLALRVLEKERYSEIAHQLRDAGFEQDVNEAGRFTRQRWRWRRAPVLKVDFLIPPTDGAAGPGDVQSLETDFGAMITPGLEAAFEDRRAVRVAGRTPLGDFAERTVFVCEAGAYVLLKALACRGRDKPKDAYDLDWMLRAYGGGVADVAMRFLALPDSPSKRKCLRVLTEDFASIDHVGPRRAARFMRREDDLGYRTDVHGRVAEFLRAVT